MARKCAVCGRNADTMLSTANTVGDLAICYNCYARIPSYNPRAAYASLEEVNKAQQKVLQELEENDFPAEVIEAYNSTFEAKKSPLTMPEDIDCMMTTTPSFEGYTIKEYLGVISAEVVLGTGFFSGFNASLADTFGMEADMYGTKIDQAQAECQKRAMRQAIQRGGNAIVGTRMELESFTNDLIAVIVSGTVVRIEKKEA